MYIYFNYESVALFCEYYIIDQWLKTGTVSKRKTTESTASIRNTQDMPLLINNFVEENPKKKLPQVSDTKIRK